MNKTTYLRNYRPPYFKIPETYLEFTLSPTRTIVKSQLKITREINQNIDLILDGENLQLLAITLNNQPVNYRLTPKQLIIYSPPSNFSLEIMVAICPEKNLTGLGLYLSKGIFCTQNEPQGFRTITYFLDRPDILSRFTVLIHAPKDFTVVTANGNLVKRLVDENMQHLWWYDPFPKSAYLFALVAGHLNTVTDYYRTSSGKKIELKIHAAADKISYCSEALTLLKQAMEWDEEVFGLAYDLGLYQIVAIDDFNFGAMENKSLNIFNSKVLLLDPNIATDNDYRRVASVVAHEYFHNWTGNRVTLRDWFQIGLKEGLTTLREQLFMEDRYGESYSRIESIQHLYNTQFPEDNGPLAHPIQLKSYQAIDNFYTATVYEKSSEVFRILITRFGRNIFIKILQEFLKKMDGLSATFEDFYNIATKITGINLDNFFNVWYRQKGLIELKIIEKNEKNNLKVTLTQKHPQALKNFEIPIHFSLFNDSGERVYSSSILLKKKKINLKFRSNLIGSWLQNFSAPVKVSLNKTPEQLLFLAQNDNDPINRWYACQSLIKATIQDIKLLDYLTELFRKSLTSSNPLFLNLLFPSLKLVLNELDMQLPLLDHQFKLVQSSLANALVDLWPKLYQSFNQQSSYYFNLEESQKRSLKNLVLFFWLKTKKPPYEIALEQLSKADNLTDRYGAITALLNSAYPDSALLLDNLPWRKNNQLFNKWLTLNATWDHPKILTRLKKIVQTPPFQLTNPNNVFALIKNFTLLNPMHFHTPEAYDWLTDLILQIEIFNPNLAASLINELVSIKGATPKILADQKRHLSLLKEQAHSLNVLELVNKGLK